MIERFEKGEALQSGRWVAVTTFLVTSVYGDEWCCLDGHHGRDSEAVREVVQTTIKLLKEASRGFHGHCRGCGEEVEEIDGAWHCGCPE